MSQRIPTFDLKFPRKYSCNLDFENTSNNLDLKHF